MIFLPETIIGMVSRRLREFGACSFDQAEETGYVIRLGGVNRLSCATLPTYRMLRQSQSGGCRGTFTINHRIAADAFICSDADDDEEER